MKKKKPDPNSHYTAWSSMSSLIKKELVVKENKLPARYSLTEEGRKVASRLLASGEDDYTNQSDADEPSTRSPSKTARYEWVRSESIQSISSVTSEPVLSEPTTQTTYDFSYKSRNEQATDDLIELTDNDSEIVEIRDDSQGSGQKTNVPTTSLLKTNETKKKKEVRYFI